VYFKKYWQDCGPRPADPLCYTIDIDEEHLSV